MLHVYIRQFDVQGKSYCISYKKTLVIFIRKLSTYAFCRDRMLDSMCLLSICKQLFAEKVALRKEAMKAVLEWDIDSSDRSRSQVKKKLNFLLNKNLLYFL
jgi:hypothetical protein